MEFGGNGAVLYGLPLPQLPLLLLYKVFLIQYVYGLQTPGRLDLIDLFLRRKRFPITQILPVTPKALLGIQMLKSVYHFFLYFGRRAILLNVVDLRFSHLNYLIFLVSIGLFLHFILD